MIPSLAKWTFLFSLICFFWEISEVRYTLDRKCVNKTKCFRLCQSNALHLIEGKLKGDLERELCAGRTDKTIKQTDCTILYNTELSL